MDAHQPPAEDDAAARYAEARDQFSRRLEKFRRADAERRRVNAADPLPEVHQDPGRYLRAVRRVRGWSQRELAARAGVAASVVDRIEAGGRTPTLATMGRLLDAAGMALVVVDRDEHVPTGGLGPVPHREHDALRDAAGRRFPAHLSWRRVTGSHYLQDPPWWGLHVPRRCPVLPTHYYWRGSRGRGPVDEVGGAGASD